MEEPLEQLLGRLRDEIDKVEQGTGDREHLARLAGEVEERLSPAEAKPEGHEPLIHELQEGVRRFEVTHPELARVIGQIADALSGIGL